MLAVSRVMPDAARASRVKLALLLAGGIVFGAIFGTKSAHAGGFEMPDNGAQAVGRGAAFVARADDGTAIYWNPAGLARQRGTRLYGGGNLFLHSFSFQRAGSFPDDPNDQRTPWGDKPFPLVTNASGPFFAPFIAVSTDFGTLDRFTVAAGAFGPPTVGNRTFPLGVQGAPAASRYDFIQSRSTIIYPTLSAAYRVTRWLDLGVSTHLVLGSFDQTNVSYADLGQCPNVEYQPCDSRSTLVATATSFAATFGALVRPLPSFAFGLTVKTPTALNAEGTVTPQAPAIAPITIAPGNATLTTSLPLSVRAGGRYIALDHDFELYDLELDFVYEAWGSAQGEGPRLQIPALGQFKDIDTLVVHGYKDTFGVRGGGAYNMQAFDGIFTLRGGAYFDSSATGFEYTRLDFDTLTKIAGTLGFGYRKGAFAFDVGYAAVASIPRLVGTDQGKVRPVNGAKNGRPIGNDGKLFPAVNEGAYRGFTHLLSIGVTVTFDELFGPMRASHYGNPYEPGYVPGDDARDEKKDEKGDDDGPKRDDDGDRGKKKPKKDLELPPDEPALPK
ncbi:MAG: outer membrane protein transport protein [Deltaproteobacteria bacterium]|nr:outer membrane protein transport protein [Deltaproteobacteria bacterium]